MLTVTINGKVHRFDATQTLLHALRQLGIEIPTLYHDERITSAATCRMCLVHVAGHPKLVTASITSPPRSATAS